MKHLGGPGDQGIDLLLAEETDRPFAVQVKRRSKEGKKESVKIVRELLGSLVLEGLPRGILVSTAPDFSRPAKKATLSAQARAGIAIELYNLERLKELLKLTAPPEEPWLPFVESWQP